MLIGGCRPCHQVPPILMIRSRDADLRSHVIYGRGYPAVFKAEREVGMKELALAALVDSLMEAKNGRKQEAR